MRFMLSDPCESICNLGSEAKVHIGGTAKATALAVLFGTSGWGYQEWVGRFYPDNRVAKLPFYSRVFDSVEVDSSFYRPPSKPMSSGWAKATGPSFRFSLKMPRAITHGKRLRDCARETAEFIERIEPIRRAGKLGCLLLQFPASFTFDQKAALDSYLNTLPEDISFAVEFRHRSWARQETWGMLEKHGVANTITDSPLEFLSKPVVTAAHAYVRWHGRGDDLWYDYRYSERELLEWKQKLEQIENRASVVYAYFNNHYGANAPSDLLALLGMRGELSEAQAKAARRAGRALKKATRLAKLTDYL